MAKLRAQQTTTPPNPVLPTVHPYGKDCTGTMVDVSDNAEWKWGRVASKIGWKTGSVNKELAHITNETVRKH